MLKETFTRIITKKSNKHQRNIVYKFSLDLDTNDIYISLYEMVENKKKHLGDINNIKLYDENFYDFCVNFAAKNHYFN